MELVAKYFRVEIQYLDVFSGKDIEAAFQVATEGRNDAILMLIPSRVAAGYQTAIAELAVKHRLPAMSHRADFVEAGGLLTYGVNIEDLDRRAATYVDRILKGAKPAELPVEQPRKFELLINLKTAKQIGLTIPPNVLARADRVIK